MQAIRSTEPAQKRPAGPSPRRLPWLFALLTVLLVLLVEQAIEHFARLFAIEQEKISVHENLATVRARLEGAIDANLLLVHGLTAVISAHPDIDQKEFSRIARNLVIPRHALRNIAGAPDMVISLMYPLAGNEAAIGLDYRRHPTQAAAALRAMATGQAVVAGPLRLEQGGTGIVAREPVYVPAATPDGKPRFWGLVSAVIDIDRLYRLAGLAEPDPDLQIALRGTDGKGAQGEVFFGDGGIFGLNPVTMEVSLPGGTWQIAAIPAQGWGRPDRTLWLLRLLGIMTGLAAAAMSYRIAQDRQHLAMTAARLRSLLNTLPDLVWMKDPNGAYLACNPRFEQFFGASEEAIRGKTDYDFVPAGIADFFREKDLAAIASGGPTSNDEWVTFASDNHRELLATIKTPVHDQAGNLLGVLGIARDITERRQAEEKIGHLNRVYAVLSGINESIVRLRDPDTLFHEACRIAVEVGGFRMAWIGMADPTSGKITPVASAGQVDGYLEGVHISLGEDEHGSGPTALALKRGEHITCDDIANDPSMAPWREAALARGYRSSVGLPIRVGDQVRGVFNLYADLPYFFDEAELHLLDELALDIGFALEFSETDRARETLNRHMVDMLESMSDGFISLDRDWHYRYVNRKAGEMLAQSPDELVGRHIWRDLPAGIDQPFHEAYKRAMSDGAILHQEAYIPSRDQWIEGRIYPSPDGISVFFADVSARKQAEAALREQEEFFRLIAENMGDLVAVLDLKGHRLYNSPSYSALFGDPEALKGTDSFAEIHPDDREQVRQAFEQTVATGIGQRLNFRFVLPDGQVRDMESQGGVIRGPDGQVERIVVVSRDITERKRMEHEIRQLNADLEERVLQRTAELAAANKELETFTYSVSHDLKAPLRGIDGYSRLLLDDHLDQMDEEGRLFLANVRHGVDQMNQLIEDLLAYSRMERRDLRGGELDLARQLAGILAERQGELDAKGVTIKIDLAAGTVRADPDGLNMVLRNLIDNAVKFSRDSRPPVIEIKSENRAESTILSIKDNGIGFDMQFQERIFEIFQRLQRAEDYPGTGVGLAIVRKAMLRMGGRVWAESTPGQGATFYLELPR